MEFLLEPNHLLFRFDCGDGRPFASDIAGCRKTRNKRVRNLLQFFYWSLTPFHSLTDGEIGSMYLLVILNIIKQLGKESQLIYDEFDLPGRFCNRA